MLATISRLIVTCGMRILELTKLKPRASRVLRFDNSLNGLQRLTGFQRIHSKTPKRGYSLSLAPYLFDVF